MYYTAARAAAYGQDDADMELQSPPAITDDSELLLALMKRVQASDQAAFEALYRRTVDRVYGLATRILNSPMDAEEIVCELFAKVWEFPDRYTETRGSVIAWLVMQCRSRCLDLLRRQATQRRFSDRLKGEHEVSLQQEPAADVWNESLCDQSLLLDALQQLTLQQRQMLALAYFKGLSHNEIARHNAMPLGTVKAQIRNAQQQLQAYFQG